MVLWMSHAASFRKSSRLLVRVTLAATCWVTLVTPDSAQSMSSGTPTAEQLGPPTAAPVDPLSQFAPGMSLEVFKIQGNNLPEQPSGIPIATLFDERMPTFGYKAVLEEPELATHRRNILGLQWTGLLHVTEAGRHVISLVNSDAVMSCLASITLQDKPILSFKGQLNVNRTFDTMLQLEPGLYNLYVWFVCNNVREDGQFQLKMRGPNDRIIVPIPSGRFVHAR